MPRCAAAKRLSAVKYQGRVMQMSDEVKFYHSGARVHAARLEGAAANCRNGQASPCTAACPYGLDVRGLVQKIRRGSFRGAYNLMEEQLLFPRTLCAICGAPCRGACADRSGIDPIRLPELEQAVFDYCSERKPSRFRIPPKAEKIAVVGAGLSGLSCACTLAAQGYAVTVYDCSSEIGGSLHGILPAEQFLPELTGRTDLSNVCFELQHPVSDLQELSEYDSILLAIGKKGTVPEFGDIAKEKVFRAGELTGGALTDAVNSGRRIAALIDAYLKTGMRPAEEESTGHAGAVQTTQRTVRLSKEEAVEEASRCRLCDCRLCLDRCAMLTHYKKTPTKIVSDVRVTLNPVDGLMARTATRMICSCNDCGLCGEVCPEGIDLGTILMEARTVMNQEGSIPPAFHDFWMRDMAFSCSEKVAWVRIPENGMLFFPGCQLGASAPDYVEGAYALLQKQYPGTGILLGCCGVPAKWAGETQEFEGRLDELRQTWLDAGKPCLITACPTCKKTLQEALPEIEIVSLYALLKDANGFRTAGQSESVAVFHPCSSRNDREEQESVRALLQQMGIEAKELEDPADRDGCCGYGGHIYPAGAEVFRKTVERRIASDQLPYVTYCINCSDVFSAGGKDCRHILGLLTGKDHREQGLPSLQQRRLNRTQLKMSLSGETVPEEESMDLIISGELRQKLNEQLILDEDLEAVIRHCEETNQYLKKAGGECIGHLRQGCVTYWAQWCREDGQIRLVNAYSHRMVIEGE